MISVASGVRRQIAPGVPPVAPGVRRICNPPHREYQDLQSEKRQYNMRRIRKSAEHAGEQKQQIRRTHSSIELTLLILVHYISNLRFIRHIVLQLVGATQLVITLALLFTIKPNNISKKNKCKSNILLTQIERLFLHILILIINHQELPLILIAITSLCLN